VGVSVLVLLPAVTVLVVLMLLCVQRNVKRRALLLGINVQPLVDTINRALLSGVCT
jgi:Flp pilus assembly protein TadB